MKFCASAIARGNSLEGLDFSLNLWENAGRSKGLRSPGELYAQPGVRGWVVVCLFQC